MVLLICYLNILLTHAISSIPITYVNQPYFESRFITLIQIDPLIKSSTVTFQYVKRTVPQPLHIILAIAQMDYQVNYFTPWGGTVQLDINLMQITTTFMTISAVHSSHDMNKITISTLIFDQNFPYLSSFFKIQENIYTIANFIYSIPLTYTLANVYVLRFLTSFHFQTTLPNIDFTVSYTMASNTTLLMTQLGIFSSLYSIATVKIKWLFVYTPPIPTSKYQIQTYFSNYVYPATSNLLTTSIYKPQFTAFLFGIGQFVFTTTGNTLQSGMTFFSTFKNSTTIQTHFDYKFQRVYIYGIAINTYGCKDPIFGLVDYNSTSNKTQCYDSCQPRRYVHYHTPYKDFMCFTCNFPCFECDDTSICKNCYPGYQLAQNSTCIVMESYYLVSNTSLNVAICTNLFVGCKTCGTYGNFCVSCLKGYYYTSAQVCAACAIGFAHCEECTLTQCLSCLPTYEFVSNNTCGIPSNAQFVIPYQPLPCTDPRCSYCLQTALDNCIVCHSLTLTIINGRCVSVCGDNLILDDEVCDDGNKLSYDGCSQDCLKIQDQFACRSSILNDHSQCFYTKPITLSLESINKRPLQNIVDLIVKNSAPKIRAWSIFSDNDLKQIIKLRIPNLQNKQNTYKYDYKVSFLNAYLPNARLLQSSSFNPSFYEFLSIQISYYKMMIQAQSLNHQHTQITFDSLLLSAINVFSYTGALSSKLQFVMVSQNNHMIQYHQSDYYNKVAIIKGLAIMVSILTVLMIVFQIVAFALDKNNGKQILITLETAFLIQLTYFSLIGIGQFNPLFESLAAGLKFTSGYDFSLSQSMTSQKILLTIGIQSANLSNNVNISISLPLIFSIIGVVLFIFNKFKHHQWQNQILQQNLAKNGNNKTTQKQINHLEKQPHITTQNKLLKISKILLGNCSFGLFLFFLYKYLFFISIQVKYGLTSLSMTDAALIAFTFSLLFFYILLLVFKQEMFQYLLVNISNPKPLILTLNNESHKKQSSLENLPQSTLQNPQLVHLNKINHMNKSKSNKPRIYILILIIQHIINIITVVFFYQTAYNGIVPITLYVIMIAYITFYDNVIYIPPQKIRLYFYYLVGIIIQGLIMYRKLTIQDIVSSIGGEQTDYGLYLPYSILILLLIVLVVAYLFLIYSIKRIRCCKLQIQWQRMNINVKVQRAKDNKNNNNDNDDNNDDGKNSLRDKMNQSKGEQQIYKDSSKIDPQKMILRNNLKKKGQFIHQNQSQSQHKNSFQQGLSQEQHSNINDYNTQSINQKHNLLKQFQSLAKKQTFVSNTDTIDCSPQWNPRQIKRQIKSKLQEFKLQVRGTRYSSKSPTKSKLTSNQWQGQLQNKRKYSQKPYTYTNTSKYDLYNQYRRI